MSGSNDYVIKLGADGSELAIAGQLEGTMTRNGVAVETTNKANNGKITYLDGYVSGDQVGFAGTFTLSNETVQNTIKAAIESGTHIPGVVEGVGGEKWQCDTWRVQGRSDSAPVNGVATMAVSFLTSGNFTPTAPS